MFDLTLTSDEIAELTTLEKSFEACGIAFKQDGSINIRRTVFNIARSLSQQGDRFTLAHPTAWGNTAFSAEAVEAYLFQLDIEELTLKQIKSALSYWCRRGIIRRWLSVAVYQAVNS